MPPYRGALLGRAFARSNAPLAIENEVGFFGYFAGEKPVIDLWALSDPLLARIPFRPGKRFRVGHYKRELPSGYAESRITGKNLISDPQMAQLYERVRRVVSGPIFTWQRFQAIAELHGLGW
jgi:arabinofuranosyltransferase